LANLIENALKYTPAGGRVGVSVTLRLHEVDIRVADTGPGIPDWARGKVFDSFFRLEASRTTHGNGLGLSLVRAVVGLHDGTIVLDDTDRDNAASPGLAVIVTLPLRSDSMVQIPGEAGH
jgi:signal transduction histidine kinase